MLLVGTALTPFGRSIPYGKATYKSIVLPVYASQPPYFQYMACYSKPIFSEGGQDYVK